MARVLWPRSFLFVVPIFIILTAFSIKNFFLDLTRFNFFKKPVLIFVCLLIFCFILYPTVKQDFLLLTDPVKFKWTRIDNRTFINGWGSGYAMTELGQYLEANAQDGQLLFLDMSLGYPFAYIYLYQDELPKLKLVQINFNLEEYVETAKKIETVRPILILLNPDRRPEDGVLESSDICRNKKLFYQPNKTNHLTLCFVE